MQMSNNKQELVDHLKGVQVSVKALVVMKVSMISSDKEEVKEDNHLGMYSRNSRNSFQEVPLVGQENQLNNQPREKISL